MKQRNKLINVNVHKPLKIFSNELTYQRSIGLTTFKGHVRVWHDSISLKSDELRTISQNQEATAEGHVTMIDRSSSVTLRCGVLSYLDKMQSCVAYDQPVLNTVDQHNRPLTMYARQMKFYSKTDQAVANQNVTIVDPIGVAKAQKAIYFKKENKIFLTGDPVVRNIQGKFAARHIVAYLGHNERVILDQFVHVDFYPGDVKKSRTLMFKKNMSNENKIMK
jgi:lipopolysaccharide export system protein LptA